MHAAGSLTPQRPVGPGRVLPAARRCPASVRPAGRWHGAGLVRALVLASLLAAGAGCAGRGPHGAGAREREIRVTPPVPDELDPLGFLLEHRAELALDEAQAEAVHGLRAEARQVSRPFWERLDSLDYALQGRLGGWLREASGAVRPRRRFSPRLTPPQRDVFEQLVLGIRTAHESARCRAEAFLTDEQRRTLAALEAAKLPRARRAI